MPVQEGTGKSAGFIVVNLTPDICRAPTAPIPYNIIAFLSDGFNTSEAQGRRVNFQGFPAFNMKSRVTRSFGDHPGVGLGLGSASVQGWCRPITPVFTVKCNKTELCRHEYTQFEMNCLGPEGPGNTIGKVIYLGAMLPGAVSPDGAIPKSSNAPMWPELPEEPSFLDKIKDSLKIESVKDAVALAQRAYELGQVDWSNPSAALGALAGMAGRAGLGDVVKAINLGKKALDTNWSKPAEALKAAAGMAGDAWALAKSSGLLGKDDDSKKESTTPAAKKEGGAANSGSSSPTTNQTATQPPATQSSPSSSTSTPPSTSSSATSPSTASPSTASPSTSTSPTTSPSTSSSPTSSSTSSSSSSPSPSASTPDASGGPALPPVPPMNEDARKDCEKEFNDWLENEKKAGTGWTKDLPDCPPNLPSFTPALPPHVSGTPTPSFSSPDPKVWSEPHNPNAWGNYHPGAEYGIRTNTPGGTPGNQCTYDSDGNLIRGGPGAGTADKSSPGSGPVDTFNNVFGSDGHMAQDVKPYDNAVCADGGKPGKNVDEYLKVRPTQEELDKRKSP